ncbi:uncharacterized protein LOC114264954 [Camellia sinensis]|uniref:uncharacterized protein LOC114264954 n=1 Tax=Camellia sinensis TaxID=4442 RepID=UPI001036507D|nr:uncharacterized protein LOC114264954 [Camellia sinensis]
MYSTICKQNDNDDHEIARFPVNGFRGILRGWWDNIITKTQQTEILTAFKRVTEPITGNVITEQDAVYTLINTILHHFVGASTDGTEDRSRELLQNLGCPSLSYFRWYKDVFMMRVVRRSDTNSDHWKAKFIDGLPTLFVERIRKKLRDKHSKMSIPYFEYTYGQLIRLVTEEGLALYGNSITSIHPPPKSLELRPSDFISNKPLNVIAFVEPPQRSSSKEPLTDKEIILLIKQSNYTNLYCQTVGKQLTRIEETVTHLKESCQFQPKPVSIHPVTIKPSPTVTNFNLKSRKPNTEFMDTLINKIEDLHIGESSQVNMLSSNHLGSQEESYNNLTPSQISKIQANFQNEPSTINRVHYGQNTNRMALSGPSRYYYPRPTPMDILYEEDFVQNQQ